MPRSIANTDLRARRRAIPRLHKVTVRLEPHYIEKLERLALESEQLPEEVATEMLRVALIARGGR